MLLNRKSLHRLESVGGEHSPGSPRTPKSPAPFLRFLLDSALYGVARVGNQLTALVGVAIYTRWLLPRDFGAYVLLVAVSGLVVSVTSSVLVSGVFPLYHASRPERRPMFLSTACTLAALAAGLACLLLALFAPWLAGPLVGGDEYAAALRVFLLQVFAQTAVQVPLEILRLRERTSAFAAWSLLLGGTPVAAGALALFLVPRDLVAMLAAQGVGALTILAAVYLSARRDWHLIVDSAAAGAALRFGLPLIPVMAANWVMLSTDRFVLTHTAGLAVAGRYAVSVTAGRVIELVIQALNMAWAPRFFARAREPDFGRDNRATLTTLVLGTACLVYGFLVVSADVTRILLPSASPDVVVVAPIIGAACGIMVLYYIYVNVLYLERRTVQIAVNVTVGAFAAVALNLLLTPRWHMTGAALSLVGAVIILVTATVWSARGHRVIMLDRTAIVWAVSSLAVLAGLGISLRVFNTPGAPGWKALLFAIGLGAVGFIGWRRGTYRFHSEASESTAR